MHNGALGAQHRHTHVAFTVTGASAGIETIDAQAAELGMVLYPAPLEPRRYRSGAHRLAGELLLGAIDEAGAAKPSNPKKVRRWAAAREKARFWLREAHLFPLLSARICFEALDMDYDAAVAVLEKRWAAST